MAGNWQDSSRFGETFLMDGHTILRAECRDLNNQYVQSELDLDDHVGDDITKSAISYTMAKFRSRTNAFR